MPPFSRPRSDSPQRTKTEFAKLVGSRSGGAYMPLARLQALQQAAACDKTSPEYHRLSWDALRKSIIGIVKTKQVVPELFVENLIRGWGLFARSVMKVQAASLSSTSAFAVLVAITNTKLPQRRVGAYPADKSCSFKRSVKVCVIYGQVPRALLVLSD